MAELRGQGKSPKQIARILGMSPSVVNPIVRAVAAEAQAAAGEPALVGCWISAGWRRGLMVDPAPGWVDVADTVDGPDIAAAPAELDGPDSIRELDRPGGRTILGGLVAVLVARRHRWGRVSVCGYLADCYCLGVKNALGPTIMSDVELPGFRETYFASQPYGWQDAPLDLAADVVLGSVEYARGLGFEPHPDLAPAAAHLGAWEGPSAITFGRGGQPFYISGPYDDPAKVMRTLQATSPGAPPALIVGQAG
ncbi:Helix-turn-helix domain-containing protein [Frankia sp. AiPs1]|uniref:helix-turn-helix domain-containing protein n=1 Tax=Frankia sp. AiPa1 TaxID=573492 RepID=UPI00202AF35C|nr:helix-turn-helix domain-containing protein [Frankia sp. AiPa1]MCL9762507.1 helix-turn-helix domain-containing protein [Frankia sp. AiPa1]